MSRQANLPPRCPFQKKPITRPIHDPIFPNLGNDNELYPRHHKSSSQSSISEEQPAWFDDLLNDPDSNLRGTCHRRSASDSVALLDGVVDHFPSLKPLKDDKNSVCDRIGSGLESACMYGPNSPRQRGNQSFSENAIASALSEYVSKSPLEDLDGSFCISGINQFDLKENACGADGELNAETKAVKRHSGQRSRVRKLQYIAELERTVDVYQTLESELAIRVASLLQLRVALSMENSKLKQQLAKLQQQKLIMDGQHKSLRKEVERMKGGLADSINSQIRTYTGSNTGAEAVRSEVSWLKLDIGKLNLD
ncbi:basic leucine zipper 6 [Vitis riparia]|uniref:basic leucine zipper 6 n=1 Tax=Vitis riparia TaxID=96939 RepID=UPI00155A7EBA|nr:basic leucine zipper 6 [Vitis riparia]XP_034705587.1 basic leucine zipper 6 [Vitis riparia]XP_034705589.1 basic leucine zipper 6 [Vitis riparia]XP_034705590.1 basic leucine zipper 6 [Vitis riparia]XP_034705591.1 basic leucine zipper 6 [Vitis riparia]XP_034705592.1 basic leucine zipper 6 [Vitis riparia]